MPGNEARPARLGLSGPDDDMVPAELLETPENPSDSLPGEPAASPPSAALALPAPAESAVERELKAQAAVGGAVASVFLGSWSILFAMFTSTAALNGILGLAFAAYGIRSKARRLAIAGLVLSAAGAALAVARPLLMDE